MNASRELISKVTEVVADEVELWRNRPVDEVYMIRRSHGQHDHLTREPEAGERRSRR